jgi:hypothetical protein
MEDMQSVDLDNVGSDTESFFGDIKNLSLKHSGRHGRVLAVEDSELDNRIRRNPAMFTTFLGLPQSFKNLEHGILL